MGSGDLISAAYTYNPNNKLASYKPKYDGTDLTTVNYSYDSEQRLEKIAAGRNGSVLNLEYTYNSAQQITQIIESTASLGTRTSVFQYDARDQLQEEISHHSTAPPLQYSINYAYDLARNRVSSTSQCGSETATNIYTYIEANKLQSIADEDVAASDADNDGLTRDEEISYGSNPNDADTDDDGVNDGVEVNAYNTCPWKVDSDSDGIPDNTDSNPLKPDNCVWFGATDTPRPQAWWIDSPSKPNYNTGSNKYNYVYDIAGNLKTKFENGTIVARYYYNAQNKLVKIVGDGFTYEFLYDSQNRRIALSHNGTWRKIIHAGNIPIGELDSTNGVTRWFVRGLGIAEGTGDMIAEIDDSGDAHFYLSNHRGDTLLVLNDSGNQESYLQYDAFGNVVTNTGSFSPTYKFSTKEFLSDVELYLYQRRVYDPVAGRWTQRDPIDYQDSINLYQFCGNNPVNGVDLYGLVNVTFVSDYTTSKDVQEHMSAGDSIVVPKVTSPEDMVLAAEFIVRFYGEKIEKWGLSGHGYTKGGVRTQNGYAFIDPSRMSPDQQKRMKATLANNSEYISWGCSAGDNKKALQRISNIYKINAKGWTGAVFAGPNPERNDTFGNKVLARIFSLTLNISYAKAKEVQDVNRWVITIPNQ